MLNIILADENRSGGSTPKKHCFLLQEELDASLSSIRQPKYPDTRFTSESGVVRHSIFMEMDPRYTAGTRSMFPYRATRTKHSLPQAEFDTWWKRYRSDYSIIISVRDSHAGTWLSRFRYLYRYGQDDRHQVPDSLYGCLL